MFCQANYGILNDKFVNRHGKTFVGVLSLGKLTINSSTRAHWSTFTDVTRAKTLRKTCPKAPRAAAATEWAVATDGEIQSLQLVTKDQCKASGVGKGA